MGRPRHFEKPEKWSDFYRTTDYNALAYGFAKSYCKAHPDTDRNIVFGAASDAAFEYDCSEKLKAYKFKNYVNVKIRNAVYKKRKEEKAMVTPEERTAMIAEHKAGMSYGQIAAKHGRNKSTVTTNLLNWKRQGLFSDDKEVPAEDEKADIVPEKEGIVPNDDLEATENAAIVPETEHILPSPAETVRKLTEAGVEPVEYDGTKVYAMKGVDIPKEHAEDKPESTGRLWDDIASEIADFAAGILGAGTKSIARTSNEEMQYASVKLRTADGKKIKIKMEVI